MRQAGVLDVGCHSALLTVVQRRKSGAIEPVLSHKVRLRLHQALGPDGRLRGRAVRSVEQAVGEAVDADPRVLLPEVFAFATSVIRDAPNRDEVIARVARTTGVRLLVLPGEEEARLAYVAARHWAGPEAGPLLVLDIGGGTVELAWGDAARPGGVLSLPLGARRVTRELLPGSTPASERRLDRARQQLRRALAAAPGLPQAEPGVRVLASSKTFTQLARLAAVRGVPQRRRPRSADELTLRDLRAVIPLLAAVSVPRRGTLPGIAPHRAEQSLAGALVAETLMEACGADTVTICPWSTREGLLLEHLGMTAAGA
ncbi:MULTISPECIES: Ppx/GppA phosphatase family protein [Streptacidiphilus]|uniref:Ppx/GppA phosphatase family protein n=1 Tax=Streptacidiphilus cavernicola TaxID=3342716 RepID=A0ABV6UM47_9ACTN|nr:hypothetical protein [Streptacidiphilus jeojiense]